MIRILAALSLMALAGCSGGKTTENYICPNGPNITVSYTENAARLFFPDGRIEEMQLVDENRPDFYAGPGVTWDATEFRTARFTDNTRSLNCDQLG